MPVSDEGDGWQDERGGVFCLFFFLKLKKNTQNIKMEYQVSRILQLSRNHDDNLERAEKKLVRAGQL